MASERGFCGLEPLGREFLISQRSDFWWCLGDDVKWFLLRCHAPLNISDCCQIWGLPGFRIPFEAIVAPKSNQLKHSLARV